jgi:class 3 adenylate cyclase
MAPDETQGTKGNWLDAGELAQRAGLTVERIRQFVELGILTPEDGRFLRRDVMRARAVEELAAKGIDADAVSTAMARGELTLGYLESGQRRHPRSALTFEELSKEMGISFTTLQMVYVALGLAGPKSDEHVREEDLPMLQSLPVLFGAGVNEGEVLRFVRVWAESARRVAQFQTHYFHNTVEETFRRRGLRDNEAFESAIREVGLRFGHTGEDLLGWLFRRHAEVYYIEHEFGHVETALEAAGVRLKAPRGVEAAAFADLSGYTRLTEEAGDERAAQVSLTLAQFVNEIAGVHKGEVVKMLGDGVHFHFRDAGAAVRASLELVQEVGPRGLPPAHVGVNAGSMIYDEGDYFGRAVNIAARIASQAGAGQVFVGEDLVRSVPPQGFRVVDVGQFELKGIARPVRIYEAIKDEAS